jgi:hypothetical protein
MRKKEAARTRETVTMKRLGRRRKGKNETEEVS